MITAIYVRVSTEDQAREGYSIDAQKFKCTEYCKKFGYENIKFYIDEGISGKSLIRPKVKELLDEVKKDGVKYVIVSRLDRISRNLKDLAGLIELFNKHDTVLKSVSEELNLSSLSGRAMVQMLGVFAEFERGTIAERIIIAREQRARQGLYSAPGRIFGYNYDKTTKEFTINEQEAELVREMFELHQSGKGVDAIAKIFNEREIKTINGFPFDRMFFSRAFSNGWYYCGKFKYTTKEGEVLLLDAKNIPDPIVAVETFERSNKIYGAKALDTAKKHGDESYVFKGKLRCAYCGILMTSNTSAKRVNKAAEDKTYRYYRCYKKRAGLCNNKYWISTQVDKEFHKFLKRLGEYNSEVTVIRKDIDKEASYKQIKALEERISKEIERKKRVQYLLIDEEVSVDDFKIRLIEIEENITNLQNQISTLNESIKKEDTLAEQEQEKKIAQDIAHAWTLLNDIDKKTFLALFVKNIFISKEGITKIEFII